MKDKITILPMKFPEDKQEIADWETKYKDNPNFGSIRHFILEDDTYHGLAEVIETNHEIFPIGDDEKKLAYVAKNENNEIVAWSFLDVFDLSTNKPQMFLQYIVINPEFQHMGYGTEFAKELFFNAKKYIGVKPSEIFAYIKTNNEASISLFSKFNFSLVPMSGTSYFRAITKEPKLLNSPENCGVFEK